MSQILILNGGPRQNGNTAELIRAFREGAGKEGNTVQEFDLQSLPLHGCLSCGQCGKNGRPCIQQDAMEEIYPAFQKAEVIVLASPVYFAFVTGPLLTAVNRLFALWQTLPPEQLQSKQSVLLLTANQPGWCPDPVNWYHRLFTQAMGWKDLGVVYGHGSLYGKGKVEDPESTAAARKIGEAIGSRC